MYLLIVCAMRLIRGNNGVGVGVEQSVLIYKINGTVFWEYFLQGMRSMKPKELTQLNAPQQIPSIVTVYKTPLYQYLFALSALGFAGYWFIQLQKLKQKTSATQNQTNHDTFTIPKTDAGTQYDSPPSSLYSSVVLIPSGPTSGAVTPRTSRTPPNSPSSSPRFTKPPSSPPNPSVNTLPPTSHSNLTRDTKPENQEAARRPWYWVW